MTWGKEQELAMVILVLVAVAAGTGVLFGLCLHALYEEPGGGRK